MSERRVEDIPFDEQGHDHLWFDTCESSCPAYIQWTAHICGDPPQIIKDVAEELAARLNSYDWSGLLPQDNESGRARAAHEREEKEGSDAAV